jgi:hypothetical protein
MSDKFQLSNTSKNNWLAFLEVPRSWKTKCSRLQDSKETWQPNALYDSVFDPEPEKGC